MAGDAIASAYVVIRPDLTGFREELAAGLDEAVEGLGDKTVRINADTADAEAKVTYLDGSLDSLGARTATARVSIDDGRALTELEVVQARIDELSTETATIKVGTTGTARKDLTDIQQVLDSMRNETLVPSLDPARLEALNGELDSLDGRIRSVGSDLDSTSSSADKAAASLGAGGGGGGLMAMAAAATPALIELGAVGGGAMLGIGAAASTAALGLGAFALAAAPALTEAKTQAADLLHQWQATEQAFTDPVISEAVGLLPGVFGLLTPAVQSTSGALQVLEGNLGGSIGSPYWQEFSHYLAGEGSAAITSFGAALGGLGHLLSGVAEGLSPELSRMDSDLQRWASDLDKWGNEAANGGMSGFVSYIQANGPKLASTLEQIASDAATLARDSAPLGPVWLEIADVAAKLLGDLEGLSPTLTEVAVGLATAGYGVNRLLGPLGGLSGAFGGVKAAMADLGNFSELASGAAAAEGPVGNLISKLGQSSVISAFSTSLYGVASAEEAAGAAATAAGAEAELGWSEILGPLGLAAAGITGIIALLHSSSSASQQATADARTYAQSFVSSAQQSTQSIQGQEAAIRSQIAALQSQQEQYDFTSVAAQKYGIVAAANDGTSAETAAKIAALNAQLQTLEASYQGSTDAAASAGSTTQSLSGYMQSLGSTSNSTSGDLQNLNSALNILIGNNLNAQASLATTQTAVENLGPALAALKGHTDDQSAATASARQQVINFAQDIIGQLIPNMVQSGETAGQMSDTIFNNVIPSFEQMATKAGITGGDLAGLESQYGLTKGQLEQAITLAINSGAITSAQQQTNNLHAALDALPRSINVAVNITHSALSGFAVGTASAPGGLAMVGEKGPEAMRVGSAWQIVGAKGPEIRDVPKGAQILTADQTARLPRYADGVGGPPDFNVTVTAPPPAQVNLTWNPVYQVSGGLSGEALDQVKALDAAAQERMVSMVAGALS